jgi:RNA polymerase sigma-70 factor (ECF subfamily)
VPTDEELVAAVAGGDDDALAELYDRYSRPAYGLSLRILRDPALAQDAVQEAFLGVWRTAAAYDPGRASAQTWLLTLVHRRAVDVVRREERRRTDPLPEQLPQGVEGGADDEADLRERRRRVQAALARLADDQRQALELAYYGGLSQSELAERLGVPLGTIKSRMYVALAKLRELLDEEP